MQKYGQHNLKIVDSCISFIHLNTKFIILNAMEKLLLYSNSFNKINYKNNSKNFITVFCTVFRMKSFESCNVTCAKFSLKILTYIIV